MTKSFLTMTLIMFVLGAQALAHPGHDHGVPIGAWPTHTSDQYLTSSSLTLDSELSAADDDPVQTTVWKLADGSMGSSPDATIDVNVNSVLADVNTVAYDTDYVYIRTSGVPSHTIGPFGDGNPAIPGDLDATYRVSLNPTDADVHQITRLSNIGVAVNGAGLFNWSDATNWNRASNQLQHLQMGQYGDWNTNALWFRKDGLDAGGGHPAGGPGTSLNAATYHYHQSPYMLLEQLDPGNSGQHHSPVLGYAFDGFPIYGPYAYANGIDDSAGYQQMTSSYELIDGRSADGPSEVDYELGSFAEDFEYVEGSGSLNEYNMAFVVTPEYPGGIWAYFTTFDVAGSGTPLDGDVAFPFTVGPRYFGEVDQVIVGQNPVITVPNDVTFTFEYGALIGGDANGDGIVDIADLGILGANFNQSNMAFADGDFNDDGIIDVADLGILGANWTASQTTGNASALVPEPATLSLLAMSVLAVSYRRR